MAGAGSLPAARQAGSGEGADRAVGRHLPDPVGPAIRNVQRSAGIERDGHRLQQQRRGCGQAVADSVQIAVARDRLNGAARVDAPHADAVREV